MESRAALIASLLLLLSGCSNDTLTTPDQSVVADMGEAASDIGVIECTRHVNIEAKPFPPRPGSTLTATVNLPGATNIKWQVQRAGDGPMMLGDGTSVTVSFVAQKSGGYKFTVEGYKGEPCFGEGSITVPNPTGAVVQYRLRALPPESSQLVLTDAIVQVIGGTPTSANDIVLSSGTAVNGVLRGPDGSGVPGEVRLIAMDGPDAVGTTSAMGAFTLAVLPSGSYQPLLIPQATTLAPHLGTSTPGADFVGGSFAVGAGATVTGSVVDAKNGNAVVPNARVVLRAGTLPSSVGTSASDGTFTLHAEPQTFALSVGADDWPIATVGNVAVPATGTSIAIAYNVARYTVAGKVTRADGTTLVAGARVTIASRPLGTIGSITVGGSAAMPAEGHVVRQVSSDNAGNLPSLLLPRGTYDLIVDPPTGTSEGLTGISQTVSSAATWNLSLQPKNMLSGKITDGSGKGIGNVGVQVLEVAGLGAALSTISNGDGTYSLSVDSGAALLVIFSPQADARLAGAKLSLAAGTTEANVKLPPGLAVEGTVSSPGNQRLPSVLVEALCYDCNACRAMGRSCDTPDTPITTAFTGQNGEYTLYLPDPGDISVDGGVN
jgi:hypothetical protein